MEFKCNICNKDYKSYQSIWNHNKKFHNSKVILDIHNPSNTVNNTSNIIHQEHNTVNDKSNNVNSNKTDEVKGKYNCSKCNKDFNTRQAKWIHVKKCTVESKSENEQLKKQIEIMKQEYEKQLYDMKKQIMELLNKNCKVHPKTLTKLNNSNNTNINSNNTINNDNKVINNNLIIQLGSEDLSNVFSGEEKMAVLNKGYQCLNYLIEYTHFNHKYPKFKNILITNLQNNLAYKWNGTTQHYDVITKGELLEEIISERMYDINEFYREYKDELAGKVQVIIKSFMESMETKTYEELQKRDIKFIVYNNRDKVSKEYVQNLEIIL